jgi:hypothetical protein
VGDLLLQPIDVIVEEELAEGDGAGHEQRAWKQHQIDERRERGMDAGMDDAARMAVFPLVQILIRRLQVEIGNRMLEHQDGDGSEGEENELWHRRYFDKASAVPSHWGGGGFIRK